MKRIRDAATIIGLLEGGEVAQALGAEITETIQTLRERSDQRGKVKVNGSVTLTLSIEVEGLSASIIADIASKRPKAPRGSSFFWALDDGSLSTEHPQQGDLFAGPREARA